MLCESLDELVRALELLRLTVAEAPEISSTSEEEFGTLQRFCVRARSKAGLSCFEDQRFNAYAFTYLHFALAITLACILCDKKQFLREAIKRQVPAIDVIGAVNFGACRPPMVR